MAKLSAIDFLPFFYSRVAFMLMFREKSLAKSPEIERCALCMTEKGNLFNVVGAERLEDF